MKRTEKVLRYSIRKSVLGVGSVLICALFLGHSIVAADEEQPMALLKWSLGTALQRTSSLKRRSILPVTQTAG